MASKKTRKRRAFIIGCSIFIGILLVLITILFILIARKYGSSNAASGSAASSIVTVSSKTDDSSSSFETEDSSQAADSSSQAEESSQTEEISSQVEESSQPEESSSQAEESSQEESSQEESSQTEESSQIEESSAVQTVDTAPFATRKLAMSSDDIHRGILQLVNKQNEYLFLDNWLMPMHDLDHYGFYLDEDEDYTIEMAVPAAYHMTAFLNAFEDLYDTDNLYLMNGYRSPEDAEWLFWNSAAINGYDHAVMYVMRAGFSEHHIGCSTDLGLLYGGPYFEASEGSDYYWIYEHAADYGFILRYPEDKVEITDIGTETWHFRYVSVSVANYMYKNNLCLEEFEEMIKGYTVNSPLYVTVTDGPEPGEYAIYYDPSLLVTVPADLDYTISGNNMDGFIVIVQLR